MPWVLLPLLLALLASAAQADPPSPSTASRQLLETCDCNGKSERCFFDQELWERTGHGAHCLDCADNTAGPRCEDCLPDHYRRKDGECVPCSCDPIGARGKDCSSDGQCRCRPGFGGLRCNRCAPNYYKVSTHSCSSCGCHEPGVSLTVAESCTTPGGPCHCKDNVEGNRCQRCKPGYFDLRSENEFGCHPCFCYGHSSECRPMPGYFKVSIDTTFTEGKEGWTATDYYGRQIPVMFDPDLQVLELRSPGKESIYFTFPEKYLGDQRASYNQYLGFTLRIGGEGARPSVEDLILEGAGLRVSLPIVGQGNPLPNARNQNYSYRLNEHPDFDWTPRLRSADFMRLLSNLTAIKIKGLYVPGGVGYLDNVQMGSASRRQPSGREVATWIETCTCPEGYTGQSCEECLPGFVRDPPGGGPFSKCVKCDCHGHATTCDTVTGKCQCQHNTAGDRCEKCEPGYYGNALQGTPNDCQPCPCPNRGPCVLLPGDIVACQQCPIGSTGHSCEQCVDGYYGDPLGRFGLPMPCTKCQCNGNIDPNAVGNCNGTTGDCLKCIYNTAGRHCERCKLSFYGNALAAKKGDCKPCECHEAGTILREGGSLPICDLLNGQCHCKAYVGGRRCDQCHEGYWNLGSGRGCEPCDCDPIGSLDRTCDETSGQCRCKPGVSGRRCDTCLTYHYGFSRNGCQACNCDAAGSVSLQCGEDGQCPCRPNMEGRQCNQCKENKYNRGVVCIDCPPCYSLIEEEVDMYRDRLMDLKRLLEEIQRHPHPADDRDFRRRMRDVHDKIDELLNDAQRAAAAEIGLWFRVQEVLEKLQAILVTTGKVRERTEVAADFSTQGVYNITEAEDVISMTEDAIEALRDYLNTEAREALERAWDRSALLGEHSVRLSEMAKEARNLSYSHEQDAKEIEGVAQQALNTSLEGYRLARDTVEAGESWAAAIYALMKRGDDLTDWLERTHRLAEEAKREAHEAYDAALDIYTDGNSVQIPVVDVPAMKADADEIILKARRFQAEADGMEDQHRGTITRLGEVKQDSLNLLEAATKQQQITDELLADTDAALERARDAVASGDKTLEEAKKTLATLKEFDQSVQASKDQAAEALLRIPNIKMLIEEAERKTRDAEDALSGAERDALLARDIAQRAQRVAVQASKEALEIREGADQTKTQTAVLKNQVYELSGSVEQTGERMKGFESQAGKDALLATEALERANEGKTRAMDGIKKAKESSKTLDEILRALNRLDDIDSGLLDELERRLNQANKELQNADLDTRADLLGQARDQQRVWMADYRDQIERLQREVQNVEEIRRSLPDGCYRRVRLEP